MSLTTLGNTLGVDVSAAGRKATVMVIGNVSAGKSTFINWYTNSAVQRTGMAIESNGFTIVTCGDEYNELGGEPTLSLYPHLKELIIEQNLIDYVCTKTCRCTSYAQTSKGRTRGEGEHRQAETAKATTNEDVNESNIKPTSSSSRTRPTTTSWNGDCRDLLLQVVDLIDTPGLSDGQIAYDFDVVQVIEEFSRHVDLVLVFFEPVCQALGRTLLELSSRLCRECPEKLLFCVTKVDDIRTEQERIKVMCQTTQSLTSRIPCRHGFDLIPIYVPGAKEGTYLNQQKMRHMEGPVNRIQDVVDETQRLVDRKVEQSLNGLKRDCQAIEAKVGSLIEENEKKQKINTNINTKLWSLRLWSLFGYCLFAIAGGLHLFCVFSVPLPLHHPTYIKTMEYFGLSTDLPDDIQRRVKQIYWTFPQIFVLGYIILALLQCWLLYVQRGLHNVAVLTASQLQALKDQLTFVRNVRGRGRRLYRSFLHNTADFGATTTHKHK
eukprot:GHVS01033965.1.p1 GENE.GHVS01033965.1~~GHVS01033965.1.p1  ORF type:complete len:492 (-),score=43.85 GHVS01033965.1:640-2115(-)